MVHHPHHYLTLSVRALQEARSGTNGDIPRANPFCREKSCYMGAGSDGEDTQNESPLLQDSTGQFMIC